MLHTINYHPLHRSGCSLKRDSLVDRNRNYTPIKIEAQEIGCEVIPLFCDFKGIKDYTPGMFQLFVVQDEIDCNSFYSLN